jgi:plastocyanin
LRGDQADGVEIGGKGGKGGKGSDSGSSPISAKETSKSTPTAAPITGGGATSAKVITIVVGSPVLNKSLVFTPNDIKAAPGDILQFQFSQINHTVTQSTFNAPCQPIQESDPQAAGIHSGFIAATANATTVQTFDVPVNDTKPMFIYCAQGPHCQLGMVMTVNA